MLEGGSSEKRVDIGFFEGINSLTAHNLAKKTEFAHAENARSIQIGSIEKRQGQVVYGSGYFGSGVSGYSQSGVSGYSGIATGNSGLFYFSNVGISGYSGVSGYSGNQGMYRFTKTPANTAGTSTYYYLDQVNNWIGLSGYGMNVLDGKVSSTIAGGNAFVVNGAAANRYILGSDGKTVVTSADATGHLYNSPISNKICYYKNKLYIADFIYGSLRYKTTVLKSSVPLGTVANVTEDLVAANGVVSIKITGLTQYLYTAAGANLYEIRRGTTKVCDYAITDFSSTAILGTVTNMTLPSFLAGDEIWIAGTYTGQRIFRWANDVMSSGSNVKPQSDIKLLGNDNYPITMLTTIGNVLMIANAGSMSAWNDYTVENFDLDIGCASSNGYVKLMGSLYFLHYNGIYATSGSTPKLISNKIERYINGATKEGKEACAAGKKGRSVFFTLGDVTLYYPDGSLEKIMKDVCVEYNLVQENWFVHTNVKASQFASFIESANSDRFLLTDTGVFDVKEFLTGETDCGTEIFMRVDLPKMAMTGLWDRINTPLGLLLDTERGNSMKAFISVGEESIEYYELEGKVDKGLSLIKIHQKDQTRSTPTSARLMSISIRDSSKQLCRLNRMAIVFIPSNQDAVQP